MMTLRVRDIYNLYKTASDDATAPFIQFMLSSKLSDFESEGEALSVDDMRSAFNYAVEEDNIEYGNNRAYGTILFWITNESRINDTERLDYAETLFVKMIDALFSFELFVSLLDKLDSGEMGAKGSVILDSVLISGRLKDELDRKTSSGMSNNNHVLYTSSGMKRYFYNKFNSEISTKLSQLLSSKTFEYENIHQFQAALKHLQSFSRVDKNISSHVYSSNKEALSEVTRRLDENHYIGWYGSDLVKALLSHFGEFIEPDLKERLLKRTDTGKEAPSDEASSTRYVEMVKDAVTKGRLARLIDLKIDEYLPRYKKGLYKKTIENLFLSSGDDDESVLDGIAMFYSDLKLGETYPEFAPMVINGFAEKYPSTFLELSRWYSRPEDISIENLYKNMEYEDFERLISKAAISILKRDYDEFSKLLKDDYADAESFGHRAIKRISEGIVSREILNTEALDGEVFKSLSAKAIVGILSSRTIFYKDESNEDENMNNWVSKILELFPIAVKMMNQEDCKDVISFAYDSDSLIDNYEWGSQPESKSNSSLKEYLVSVLTDRIGEDMDLFYRPFLDDRYTFTDISDQKSKRLNQKALMSIIKAKDSSYYFNHFYSNYVSYGSYGQYALIPEPFRKHVKRLQYIDDIDEAKDIYIEATGDSDFESVEGSKIQYSRYQTEQRPDVLNKSRVDRYELTLDNVDPTQIMFDISKDSVRGANMVGHTNLGSSGFTSAWALVSFPNNEILIEQIQSDYPVLLDKVFSRMPPKKKTYSPVSYIHEESGSELKLSIESMSEPQGVGVYITPKKLTGEIQIPGMTINMQEGSPIEIMPYIEYEKITEEAEELEGIARSWSKPEEEKEKARKRAAELYRDRAKEVRRRLDEFGVIPRDLYYLRKGYSEDDLADAKRHIDIISQNYPYLVMIKCINTAIENNKEFVKLVASGGDTISNKAKKQKIYVDMPTGLDAVKEEFMGFDVWKIAATQENIEKLRLMMPIRKPYRYNYSLLPSQNESILSRVREEEQRERRESREKGDIQLERKHLDPIFELFEQAGIRPSPEDYDSIISGTTVGNLLRFIGKYTKDLRAAGVSKKRIKQVQSEVARLRLAEMALMYGLSKRASVNLSSLYGILADSELHVEAFDLIKTFDSIMLKESIINNSKFDTGVYNDL